MLQGPYKLRLSSRRATTGQIENANQLSKLLVPYYLIILKCGDRANFIWTARIMS